jgi:hypothetical protein
MLGGPTLQPTYPNVGNPAACCALCRPPCVGFSIVNGTCLLKASLQGQTSALGATSGIVGNSSHFKVHYGNPYMYPAGSNGTDACQADEIA